MKKHLLFILTALLPLVASAEKVEIDGIWYNLVSKAKQAEVTFKGDSFDSYDDEYSGSITIPATVTYNGVAYSVTSIESSTFQGCSSLTAITIPGSVTSIGESAFEDCGNLTAITIPENSKLTSIEKYAFYGCSSLTDITIPEGVTSIGEYAFRFCRSLTTINIPEGVTSTEFGAFADCSSITSITLPEGVTSIGNCAFISCSSLTDITIPESVVSIGDVAFEGCSSLTAIAIPEGVTSIGHGAFANCTSLIYINIPKKVAEIKSGEWGTFQNCSSLTSITIPENSQLTSIGYRTFSGCSSLTDITIPEGVTSIKSGAFHECSSLTDITIPEGVTSIDEYAFSNCRSLTAITIPEGVTSIGSYAFDGCSGLTSITIPENSKLTSIGSSAFSGCSGLRAIVLPKSVMTIGSNAFANCSELTDVYCNAKTVPSTEAGVFDGSYIEYVTLHVPTSAINSYKSTAPWSGFGKFETTSIAVERITLSQSSATLTEGETLTLTATVAPNDAEDLSIIWSSSNPSVATVDKTGKVTSIASGTATITATANDGSGVSAQCELTVNELILGKCATPTISYKDGKVTLTCKTEGAKVITTVANGDDETFEILDFELIPTYTLTAYATKENYEKSDVATFTLCWVPCEENHDEDNGILIIPAKPVLISTQGGAITVSGLAEGTEVAAYDLNGIALATATATDGTATLTTDLTAGSIAIVKIGDYSIKVAIK